MQKIVPLDVVQRSRLAVRDRASVAPSGGCAAGACGGADAASPPDRGTGPADLAPAVWERVKDHPCYSPDAHHDFARLHVAVAPACNVQCHYCNRKYDCANESRPGVVSERLTPAEAARKAVWVAGELPQLSVVGIAGPGDALADPRRTFETCRRIADALPDIKLCLSTNGLALPDCVDAIKAHGIDHVTITINALDPAVAARIYAWVAPGRSHGNRRLTGIDGARLLLERQWQGLDLLVAAGVLVKVNSVLIPGINDGHLPDVNAELKARGAFLHNVMPLISDPAHGTRFGLDGQRGPTPVELQAVRERLGGGARLMTHCRQCRADAVGLLGTDQHARFSRDRLPAAPTADPAPRRAYRAVIERERRDRAAAAAAATESLDQVRLDKPRLIAVCSKGGGRINQHFGQATAFAIYAADGDGVRLVGHRQADRYCRGGYGVDAALTAITALLGDVDLVLCARIGKRPRRGLEAAGLRVLEIADNAYIEPAIAAAVTADSVPSGIAAHSA